MIDLILVGSGGGMPMPNRHLSSLLMSYKGRKILIDCGEGTQVAMRKMNTGFKSIDIICLTHFHGDHIFGLPGLLSTIGNSEREEPIIIIGPEGLRTVLGGLLVATYLPFDLYLVENPNSTINIVMESKRLKLKNSDDDKKSDIRINTLELEHSSQCLGYKLDFLRTPKFLLEKANENGVPKEIWKRLQKGEKVLYEEILYEPNMVLGGERRGIKISFITDTRPIESIKEFIKGSDLLICEGTYGSDDDSERAIKNLHMTFSEAANLASKSQVKELLLTHFGTAMDNPDEYKQEASNIFGNTIIGYDGYRKILVYE